MNQKTIIAILSFFIVILLGVTVYLMTMNQNSQSTANRQRQVDNIPNKSPAKTKDYASWKTSTNNDFDFQISYPKTWTYEEGETLESPYVLLSHENTRFVISPQGDPGRGLWMETPKVTEITIDGKNATRKDWDLKNGHIHTYIKFSSIPNKWNEANNIIIENIQNKIEEVDDIISSIKFTN